MRTKVDILVAEIGSTTTVVNAFDDIEKNPKFIGQGQSSTTISEGDVNMGLKEAIFNLEKNLGVDTIEYKELLATSSAAGGLKMTVHGLVPEMTVRAAKEAALGAGANIKYVTTGKLKDSDIENIKKIDPHIILIAGGVNNGERDTALYNSRIIGEMDIGAPIIYAGNTMNHEEVKMIFYEKKQELYLVENVYPKIDELNIEPTRKVIQDVFERHIIHAPGMTNLRDLVTGTIMPTPGAVMESSKLLYQDLGSLVTIDVGGATTDIHSVAKDSKEISKMLISPEPMAKRTVEGDLGVFMNMENIAEKIGRKEIITKLEIEEEEFIELLYNHKSIPTNDLERRFVEILTDYASSTAIKRHVGHVRHLYGPAGRRTIAEGKDLSKVEYIIGTGGALSRLDDRVDILNRLRKSDIGIKLLPSEKSKILIDNNYILASLGVMSKSYPEEALILIKDSLDI